MKTLTATCLLVCAALTACAQTAVATIKLPYGAALTMRSMRFHAAQHKMGYQPAGFANTIDGHVIFGTDGEMPRSRLVSASILLNGTRYQLPVGWMYNPWAWGYEPNPHFFRLTRMQKPLGYLLQAVFSDGAGSYLAEWRITGGKVVRIRLSKDEDDVVGFYQRHK